ncbi:hypothetical protein [Acetobacter sp. LMG 32666]
MKLRTSGYRLVYRVIDSQVVIVSVKPHRRTKRIKVPRPQKVGRS